ncbi:hypothetical protein DU608_24080 [Salmonella enterica]|nr:hypothetical protein [Salmonella enterica]
MLIENGVLVADTLRRLADNEIDSDYFAICHTNENGTEIECELAITDYARQSAGIVDDLVNALEAAEKRIAEQSAIVAAAEKLVRCKGRYHSELNYRALAKLFGVVTPDLPPLEHENVHYADAAEVEITALRQRIAELEARKVNLSKLSVGEVMYVSGFSRDYAEGWCAGNDNAIHEIRTAGIKVKGG